MNSQDITNRIVFKHGEVNTIKQNVGRRTKRYIKDVFTSVIDSQWRYTLLIFAGSFVFTWTIFACFWFSIAVANGDIDYYEKWLNAPDQDVFEKENPRTPCVRHLYNFASAFLFSIETQHTIGYGFRHVTEQCFGGPLLLVAQSVFGSLIQAFLMGVIIAKLARPKKRAQNILFSKQAVICNRDGVPYLMFRIADTRKSHIVQAQVKARLVRKKITREGELINFYQQDLKLTTDECDNHVFLIYPTVVIHKIDNSSPLYNLSQQDLQRKQFEIVVMLEGGVESTGLATQARTSYHPSEIYWAHRFQSITTFNEQSSEYEIDYRLFHDTYKIEMSQYSAKTLDDMRNGNNTDGTKIDAQEVYQNGSLINGHAVVK